MIATWAAIVFLLRGSLEIDDTFPVIGRLPGLSRLFSRPASDRRGLVMHVRRFLVVGGVAGHRARRGRRGRRRRARAAEAARAAFAGADSRSRALRPGGRAVRLRPCRRHAVSAVRVRRAARPLAATPGETGCLRAGTYRIAPELTFRRAGTAEAPITLRSWPGERATLAGGTVVVRPEADARGRLWAEHRRLEPPRRDDLGSRRRRHDRRQRHHEPHDRAVVRVRRLRPAGANLPRCGRRYAATASRTAAPMPTTTTTTASTRRSHRTRSSPTTS